LSNRSRSKKHKPGSLGKFINSITKLATNLRHLVPNLLDPTQLGKQINYWIFRWKIWEHFNRWMLRAIVAFLIFFLTYLNFFDRYFLIDNYTVEFAEQSYLAPAEVDRIIDNIQQDKFLGVVPRNQYWFLNEFTLTTAAQEEVNQVTRVRLQKRIWPDQAHLQIQTEPILATLAITEKDSQQYWRIGQNGEVYTADKAGLREKLIHVLTPITISETNSQNERLTLNGYNFQRNPQQFNRLWFVVWAREQLDKYDLPTLNVTWPSLLDTDVILETTNRTQLYFDSNPQQVSQKNLRVRLQEIFRSQILDDIRSGKISYIDFRSSQKRVFVCYRDKPCAKENS
jgi:hypothetical protein